MIVSCGFFSMALNVYLSYLRKSSTAKPNPSVVKQQPDTKRKKTDVDQALMDKTKQGTGKMIELNYVSSDEEI